MLALSDDLVDDGATLVLIEHDQRVIAHANHVIDMGPGAGLDGGTVMFEGTPSALAEDSASLTGRYLQTR